MADGNKRSAESLDDLGKRNNTLRSLEGKKQRSCQERLRHGTRDAEQCGAASKQTASNGGTPAASKGA